jgi:hypothetical protein
MAVKILKLSTGECILADFVNEDADYLYVRRPLLMLFNDKGISLAMWCPVDMSEPVKISRSQIVGEGVAVEPLANEYNSKFGGIVTAPAGLVV